MEWIFGKRRTPEAPSLARKDVDNPLRYEHDYNAFFLHPELLRCFFTRQRLSQIIKEHQRLIRRSIREVERERAKMERSEGKIIADIKKAARDNQIGAAKIMAKDLVRTRAQVQKMYKMKAISLRIQTIKSQAAMNNALRGVTRAMIRMNRSVNLPSLQRIMMEFQKQSEIMNMKEETMEETMDDMWSDEEEEAATDDVLNQVLDEIGINLGEELGSTPLARTEENTVQEKRAVAAAPSGPEDDDLMQRLQNLRKND